MYWRSKMGGKAPVIVPRWAFDGVEALDSKIYFVGGKTEQ